MAANPTPDDLLARLEALEARLAAVEGRVPQDGGPRPAASADGSGHGSGSVPPAPSAAETPASGTALPRPAAQEDPFWALTALKEHAPAPGAVVFAGSVDVGAGHLEYQWGRPTEHLQATDWAEHAESVAALGHPLRLAMLQRLLEGEHTVAQLVDELELGSTGVAYHHLSALQSGGWVISPRRGSWALAVPRVVPLLTIITALEKG